MKTPAICTAVIAIAVLAMGCATHDGSAGSGSLTMTLGTTSRSGVEYRLRDATFEVRGLQDEDVLSEDFPPEQALVNVPLPSGDYQVTLVAGWYMEHSANGQPFTPIPADLVSQNPVAFTIVFDQ